MKSTSRFNSNHKGIECLNCKQPIHNMDNFCSNCGQVNDTKSVSIKQFITELLGGFFAFDTRSIKTLFLLLIKPGKVSDEYINGKRMKYVNPFQLYLHTSIIFFLVTGIFSSIDEYNNLGANISNNKEVNQKKKDSLVNALTSLEINTDNDGFSINFGSKKKKDSIVAITNLQDVIHQKKKEYEGLLQNKEFLQNKKLLIILENANLSSQEKNTQIKRIIESEIESYGQSILKGNKIINYQEFEEIYLTRFQEELRKNKFDLVINKSLYTENNAVEINNFSFKKYNRFINSRTKNVEKGLDSLGYKKTRKNIFWYKKLQGVNDVLKSREALNDYKKKSIAFL